MKTRTKKEERVSFRLPKKVKGELEQVAAARDRSTSWIVYWCLVNGLPKLKEGASFNQADRQPVGSLN